MARAPVAAAILATLLAAGASDGDTQSAATYRALVTVYRQSARVNDPAFLNATAAELENAVAGVIGGPTPGWSWEDARAAAIMHTDVWFRAAVGGSTGATAHLDAAARLLDHVVRTESRQRYFADRWYGLIPQLLKHFRLASLAETFETRGIGRFGREPERARAQASYRRGLEYEYEGTIQPTIWPTDAGLVRAWAGAASQYQEALTLDATLVEATLHLGRVRMLQGNAPEAERLFRGALEADDPRISYLARLYLGSLAEREGRLEEALERYGSALRSYPGGQSAVLAVAQALSRHGRQLEARELLTRFVPSGQDLVVEPMWTYLPRPRATLGDLVALLDEMRMEVTR